MKRNKGFTLVELLAVIVILAIIALIAVPSILVVIDKARVGAAKSSALGYIDAVEKQIIVNELEGSKESIKDGIYSLDEIEVDLKGEIPDSVAIEIEKGIVKKGLFLVDNNFICYNNNEMKTSKNIDDLTECSELQNHLTYEELILNGAYPKISSSELIPVTIENDGKVRKANINSKWYSYEEKEWANAVILKDNTITYDNKDVIPEENIESYFVWVPRYKYKLFDLGLYDSVINGEPTESSKAQSIDIVFGDYTTRDEVTGECTTPLLSGETGNCEVGEYMTHPAFITMDSNGLWVGKFETGYEGATTTSEAQVNSSESDKIIVKPNVYSWRGSTVSNMFTAAYDYNRELDSHMMKNTEWGAVAYLSHSIYGINGEININNNSSYKTGYSAVEGSDQSSYPGTYGTSDTVTLAYNTTTGYKASTTGNISGIYDMSGGAHEYMASYIYGSSGFDAIDISNYNSKYFDIYSSDLKSTAYNNRILGDATGEMGPFYRYKDKDNSNRYHNNWYGDYSHPIYSDGPSYRRGGGCYNGVLAGQFKFNYGRLTTDVDVIYNGTRIVLIG